jgi:starch-binding outer membrane protein, SusD/RagB family
MQNINNKIQGLLMLLLVAIVPVGCNKSFLDIQPKGKLIAQTVNDYDQLFNNTSLLNATADAQLPMGDEVVAVDPYFTNTDLRTQRLFRWDDVIYDASQDANEMTAIMPQLYTFNKIAGEVMGSAGGTDQQKQALKGEAMANRAWCYFMLANYYGKPYDSTTAAGDLCYPIITQADVTTTSFTRASIKDCYDFMISDLSYAISVLPKETPSRVRMCKSAAEALLGKIYVFMGRYSDALVQLNAALGDLPVNTAVSLYDLNQTMTVDGPWGYDPFLTPYLFLSGTPLGWNNQENLFVKQFTNYHSFLESDLLLSPAAASLFQASDQRLKFFGTQAFGGGGFILPGAMRRVGPVSVQFGMMLQDVYLLRAECEARKGDLTSAKADLETLRIKRMSGADVTVTVPDQNSMIGFVLNERTREFALQGYRWLDMRRLSVDPLFSNTVYTHQFITASGSVNTYTLKPARWVMRFPQKIIDQNPGMQNNP